MVVPAVLDLYNGVVAGADSVRHLRKMLMALRDSLRRRFIGIFVNVNMAVSHSPSSEPFHNRVYMVAALLDPNIKLAWVDIEVKVLSDSIDEEVDEREVNDQKEGLKRKIQGMEYVYFL